MMAEIRLEPQTKQNYKVVAAIINIKPVVFNPTW